jgi:menaquinone-dependent protoporphyrinogen oxidase
MARRVLVTYGSKRGGTSGIADILADALRGHGLWVHLKPAGSVRGDIDDYDAVIVGGALYAGRWHRHARRFVRRHSAQLRDRPVWLFSSGPLDDSADETDVPPTAQVEEVARAIGARAHRTFGGRLAEDARGYVARRMVHDGRAGDFRDRSIVRGWAAEIAEELTGRPVSS